MKNNTIKYLIALTVIIIAAPLFSQNLIVEHFKHTENYTQSGFRPSIAITSYSIPSSFYLGQSLINPGENTADIYFSIPFKQNVRITIVDIFGKEEYPVVHEVLGPGTYKTMLDVSGLSAGVYFYKLQADNYFEIKKMTIVT